MVFAARTVQDRSSCSCAEAIYAATAGNGEASTECEAMPSHPYVRAWPRTATDPRRPNGCSPLLRMLERASWRTADGRFRQFVCISERRPSDRYISPEQHAADRNEAIAEARQSCNRPTTRKHFRLPPAHAASPSPAYQGGSRSSGYRASTV